GQVSAGTGIQVEAKARLCNRCLRGFRRFFNRFLRNFWRFDWRRGGAFYRNPGDGGPVGGGFQLKVKFAVLHFYFRENQFGRLVPNTEEVKLVLDQLALKRDAEHPSALGSRRTGLAEVQLVVVSRHRIGTVRNRDLVQQVLAVALCLVKYLTARVRVVVLIARTGDIGPVVHITLELLAANGQVTVAARVQVQCIGGFRRRLGLLRLFLHGNFRLLGFLLDGG